MTGEQLLKLSYPVLLTDRGKKILGDPLDVVKIKAQIGALALRYKINLDDLKEVTIEQLTEAQKRSKKSDKVLTAQEKIDAKKTKRDEDKEAKIIKAQIKIKVLQDKLKSLTPTLQKYKITGRLFDKTTGDVLSGVKVELGLNSIPPEKTQVNLLSVDEELISTSIDIDFSGLTLVPAGMGITRTDKSGNFTINLEIPIIPKNQKSILNIGLLYTKSRFIPSSSPLLNGDQTVKTNLSAASLINLEKAAEQISQEYRLKIDQAKDLINKLAMAPVELILSQRKSSIHRIVDTIKSKLIPLAVGMLIAFGISKLSQSNLKTCPTPQDLQDLIRQRNRIVRQLNQIYTSIVVNVALSAAFLALATTLKGVRIGLDSLPFPQAIGTPPLKDFGGLIFAQPYSTTAKLQGLNDELEKLEKDNLSLNKSQLTSLVFLIAGTVTVLILLQGIDKMTQECIEENGVGDLELTAINEGLLDLSKEQTEDGNPVISNINGFVLSVVTDNKNPVGTLKRRFAIAKNSQGVTQLKGEQSFSASDQILIDELVFYIQQNDLKAY